MTIKELEKWSTAEILEELDLPDSFIESLKAWCEGKESSGYNFGDIVYKDNPFLKMITS